MRYIKTKCLMFVLAMAMLLPMAVVAQQLPNPGFQTFENDSDNGVGKRPIGWKAANVKRTVLGFTAAKEMISEDANGRSGKCVRIHNELVEAAGQGENAPAWISLGSPWNYLSGINTGTATAGTDGGAQFAYRPDTLSVWVKRTYTSQEDANIVVYLWKGTSKGTSYLNKGGGCSSTTHYDEESDIRRDYDANACSTVEYATQIGEGSWRSNQQIQTWREIKVPIEYLNDYVPEKMNVILSSGNYPNFRVSGGVHAGSTLYCDDIKFIYSSKAHDMLLNNREMNGFDMNTNTYVVSLGAAATAVPTVEPKRSGRKLAPSEYTVNYGPLGGDTRVTIYAEDGSSNTTYTIKFVTQLSTNPRPSEILVDGAPINNFNEYVYTYNVALPYGTTEVPAVTVTYAEDGQTSSVASASAIPGTSVVTVFAPDVNYSQNYTINFTEAALTDNTLTGIFADGVLLRNFSPTTNNYVVELPVGTTASPTITYTTAFPDEHVVVIDDKGISDGVTISVTPQGTTLTRVYRISYLITASTYSYLNDLKVDGVTIDGFAPSVLNYSYALPLGTTLMPTVTWEQGDAYQTVALQSGGLDGETRVVVTSQSGTVSIYKINFSTAKSTVCTLNNILIDGEGIDGFDPETTTYDIALPVGTTQMPVITWEQGDEYQSVVPQIASGLSGTSRLIVTAQNGDVKSYSITFDVQQADVSTLKGIMLDGVMIDGFDKDVFTYDIVLPRGTSVLPEITYTANDATQIIRVVEGGVNGTSRITVKAQTGATSVYTMNFSVMRSSNCMLTDIRVGGVSVSSFNRDTLAYTYTLPSGTIALPVIEFTKGDDYQNVMVSSAGVNGVTTITVVAEDGTQRVYSITFSVEKSASALLGMIYVDGAPLQNFSPEVMAYTYTLADGAMESPAITVLKDGAQSVSVISPRLYGVAKIEVVPEVGAKNVYTIDFKNRLSSNVKLADITVGGVVLDGFSADVADYTVVLAKDDTVIPHVGYTRGSASQEVFVDKGAMNAYTTIYVKAENGDMFSYRIYFTQQKSADSVLANILIDGVQVAGFAGDVYNYNYTLGASVTTAPSIEYVKGEAGQTVYEVLPVDEGIAVLTVVSEDHSDTSIYRIDMRREVNGLAHLSDILVDGVGVLTDSLADTVVVSIAADHVPTLGYEVGHSSQRVFVADGGVRGAKILVVAADGTEKLYTVVYDIPQSTQCDLNDIQILVNGAYVSLGGFDGDSLVYDYMLPFGTKSVPNINAVAANENENITIAYGKINEATMIDVVAADGVTTRQYVVNFGVVKSTNAEVSAIYLDGAALPGFDPTVENYTHTLPYGATTVPQLTYDLAYNPDGSYVRGQEIRLMESGMRGDITLRVISESKTDTTLYTIALEQGKSASSNELMMITVGGNPIEGFAGGTTTYNVVLPYGTTTVPTIAYTKSYPEQSVIVTATSVEGKAEVKVLSNDASKADITYVINFTVSTVHPMAITSLVVNGSSVAGFNPNKTKYVLPVTAKPIVTYTLPDGAEKNVLVDNHKMLKFEVYSFSSAETMTYEIYYYYTTDIIPNGDFSDWSVKTKYNNKSKPKGWMVPADCDDKYTYYLLGVKYDTYTTGQEAVNSSNRLRLRSWASRWSINGGVPGMASLTGMKLNLTKGGGSTSSVTGGIEFRNTPDVMKLDYTPASKEDKINNLRFVYRVSGDGETYKEKVFTDATFNNTAKKMRMDLNTDVQYPTHMNIILNSAHTENAKDIGNKGSGMTQISDLYVDNLAFEYNNELSAIKVGTQTISVTNQAVTTYSVNIDKTQVSAPIIELVGVVADQDHTVSMSSEVNGVRTATITVKGEDGSLKVYTVKINRAKNTDATLSGIKVDGAAMVGFAPGTKEYTVSLPNGVTEMPDVEFVGNAHQNIQVAMVAGELVATVKAESGAENKYKLRFVETKDDVTALAGLAVEDSSIAFDPATYSYNIDIAVDDALPRVGYTKISDGQSVAVSVKNDTISVMVYAQNGTDNVEYLIICSRAAFPTSSILTSLAMNDAAMSGFTSGTLNYSVTDPAQDTYYTFQTGSYTDKLTQTISKNKVTFAVEGDSVNTYVVDVNHSPSANTQLATIKRNGNVLPVFTPAIKDYTLEYNVNDSLHIYATTQDIPKAFDIYRADSAELAQRDVNDMYRFVVKAANDNVDTIVISLDYLENTNTKLRNVLVDGDSLRLNTATYTSDNAFDQDVLRYNIVLKSDSPKIVEQEMPAITVVADDYAQEVVVENNGVNAVTYITVKAESGAENVYELSVTTEKSTNALLSNIIVDMQALAGFSPNTYTYTVARTTPEVPSIQYVRSDAFQTVSIVQEIDSTVIKVVSESKTDTSIYMVLHKKDKSNVTDLGAIYLGDSLLSGFDKDTLVYDIDLPLGSVVSPDVAVVKGDDYQDVNVVKTIIDAISSQTTITVVAEDGTTKTYVINFRVEKSTYNKLAMINIGGAPLDALTGGMTVDKPFSVDENNYVVTLPVGTTVMPVVTWVAGDEYQTVVRNVITADSVALIVDPQTAGLTNVYTVKFVVEKSENANLNSIEIDGEAISVSATGFVANRDFDPDVYEYHIALPVGSSLVPNVTWQQGDVWQTVTIDNAADVNDTTFIHVVADDSAFTNTYSVIFKRTLSTNTQLNMISLDNVPLAGFVSTEYVYNHVLAEGTTHLPKITWEVGDIYQVVSLDTTAGINGHTIITVIAEDTTAISTYVIAFSVKKSSNTDLDSIYVDGAPLVGFDANIYNYTVDVPYGSVLVPNITAFKQLDNQVVSVAPAATLNDTTIITVYAEDGSDVEYRISFNILKSDNALLNEIKIGGELISTTAVGFTSDKDFDANDFHYNIILPYGTVALPEITYVGQVADYDTIEVTTNGVNGSSVIKVTSQDQRRINEYTLVFAVAKSDNALLKDLQLEGETLKDFDPETFIYTVTYPVGTKMEDLPRGVDVTYTKGIDVQTVTINDDDTLSIQVTVMAEDGVTLNVYVINMVILLSDNSLLDDILIDGVSIYNFSSTQYEYNYVLLPGTMVPEVEGIKGEETQEVYVTKGAVGEYTYIYVVAEDGSESEYKIMFIYTTENPSDTPDYEDVSWVPLGNGAFKASSLRQNVKVHIVDHTGLLRRIEDVEVIDPNEKITEAHVSGTILQFDRHTQILIYVFVHEGKIISSGKFIVTK